MLFAPNRTLEQRAQDKRLGQIKHQLHERGHSLSNIKILWRKNVVKLGNTIVYKVRSTEHVYSGEALSVKAGVETFVRDWLEQRGAEDSD